MTWHTNSIILDKSKTLYNGKCYFNNNSEPKINNCNVVFNYKFVNRLNALLNLIKTILSCILLYFGNMWFSTDLNKMLLSPTDTMVERVKLI